MSERLSPDNSPPITTDPVWIERISDPTPLDGAKMRELFHEATEQLIEEHMDRLSSIVSPATPDTTPEPNPEI